MIHRTNLIILDKDLNEVSVGFTGSLLKRGDLSQYELMTTAADRLTTHTAYIPKDYLEYIKNDYFIKEVGSGKFFLILRLIDLPGRTGSLRADVREVIW